MEIIFRDVTASWPSDQLCSGCVDGLGLGPKWTSIHVAEVTGEWVLLLQPGLRTGGSGQVGRAIRGGSANWGSGFGLASKLVLILRVLDPVCPGRVTGPPVAWLGRAWVTN